MKLEMNLIHVCEPWAHGNSVESRVHKWKFDWKSFKKIPIYEFYFVRRCFICGHIVSEAPIPELKGWGLGTGVSTHD